MEVEFGSTCMRQVTDFENQFGGIKTESGGRINSENMLNFVEKLPI
jgi:hypothetical protein